MIGRKTCQAWFYRRGLSEWKAGSAMGEPVCGPREEVMLGMVGLTYGDPERDVGGQLDTV